MMRAVLVVFLVLFIGISVFPQAVIKEKVEITPKKHVILQGASFNGCWYDYNDSFELSLNFNADKIVRGDTIVFQMMDSWDIFDDENLEGILQKTVTADPNIGELTSLGNGKYQFVAPQEMVDDSLTLTINYEAYQQACIIGSKIVPNDSNAVGKEKIKKASVQGINTTTTNDCINCRNGGTTALFHYYGSGQITVFKYPSHIIAYFDKEILAGRDTANIIVKNVNNIDETETDYSDTTHFEIGLKNGCGLGQILDADGNLSSYFSSIKGPLRFVVADSIDVDSAVVVLRVGTSVLNNNAQVTSSQKVTQIKPGSSKNSASKSVSSTMNKSSKKFKKITDENSCTINNYIFENKSFPEAVIQTGNIILLGQTKYYQVRAGNDSKLQIEEVKPGSDGVPQLNGGISEDVWKDNPVTKAKDDKLENYKIGVYWEKEKTIWGTSKTLAKGLIRLIGRFWEYNKNNKVLLTAYSGTETASIEIKVKEPSKLGSDNATAYDVSNNLINIDKTCITNGGKNGIPPQIIKGQMQKETNFANVYRYEPFRDIYYQRIPEKKKELFDSYNYFTVNSVNMGSISMPSQFIHNNVSPDYYPRWQRKIADYIIDDIWAYIQKPTKNNKDKPSVVGNSVLTKKLRKDYHDERKNNNLNAFHNSVSKLTDYLKSDEYPNGKLYTQTRIIASYGMLQQTFYDAHSKNLAGFKVSNPNQPPELLNEMKYSIQAYIERMGKVTKNKMDYNWEDGFENGWKSILHNYNPGEDNYEVDVLSNSKSFLPVQ